MSLHTTTPLIESSLLSNRCQTRVFLKLENCQPVGSFKIRGIGHLCEQAQKSGKRSVVCSSGGNAGLAAAYACRKLRLGCKIFVPETTPQFTIQRLQAEGADVTVHGSIWNEANEAALEYLKERDDAAFVHPYDHSLIWEGHSSMIHEVHKQLGDQVPGCIVASVGGGGLLTGILKGMDAVGWSDVPVVAMETEGAASFAAAVKAGKVVTIPGITSLAKSLGSTTICDELFDYTKTHKVRSRVITDEEAINACLRFADDHRMLVEPACGASLAFIYSGIVNKMQLEGSLPNNLDNIIIIVCGGCSVTIETLDQYKSMLQSQDRHAS